MGLSASQARLLFLTSRLSDLELRAQTISNAKIRLADEAKTASDEYTRALDMKKFRMMAGTVDAQGNTAYVDANALNLTSYDPDNQFQKTRYIKDSTGAVLVDQRVKDAYDQSGGSYTEFLNALGIGARSSDRDRVDYYSNLLNVIRASGKPPITTSDENMKSTAWLEGQVSNGGLYLWEPEVKDGKMAYEDDGVTPKIKNVSWTSGDSSIQEVDDDKGVAKAEAKYESTMADIQSKDKRFDLQLKQIDTEHQATQTTIESVKKVIDKNIERSLKMFQA